MSFGALGFLGRPAMEYDYMQDGQYRDTSYNGGYNYSPVYEPVYNQPTYTEPAQIYTPPVSNPVVSNPVVSNPVNNPVSNPINVDLGFTPTGKIINEKRKAGELDAGALGFDGKALTGKNGNSSGIALLDDLNAVYTEYKKPILIVGGLAVAYLIVK